VSTEARQAVVIPRSFIRDRHGLDFVRVRAADGSALEARVQLGRLEAVDGVEDGVEVLTGLAPGDLLLAWEADVAEGGAAP
jgi:hypothetical protein